MHAAESSRRPHAVDVTSTHAILIHAAAHWKNGPPQVPERLPKPRVACREAAPVGRSNAGSPIGLPCPCFRKVAPCIYEPLAKQTSLQPVIFGAMSLAVRVTCLEALGILLYSIGALAKMEGLAAISLQIDVVPDFNLNGERIRWVTEQSIRTSVSRPGTRIREVPWVTWKRSRNSWSGGHPLLSFCFSIDDSCGQTRFLVSYSPLAPMLAQFSRRSEPYGEKRRWVFNSYAPICRYDRAAQRC